MQMLICAIVADRWISVKLGKAVSYGDLRLIATLVPNCKPSSILSMQHPAKRANSQREASTRTLSRLICDAARSAHKATAASCWRLEYVQAASPASCTLTKVQADC